MVNDRLVTGMSHDKVGGNRSSGEFGSMLEDIFDPSSNTKFEWQRWATLRGRRMHVFSFTILKPYSKYSIRDDASGQTVVPGLSRVDLRGPRHSEGDARHHGMRRYPRRFSGASGRPRSWTTIL